MISCGLTSALLFGAAALCLGLGAALMFASFFVASEEASGRRLDNSEAVRSVVAFNIFANLSHYLFVCY